jgi:hypothetical protein
VATVGLLFALQAVSACSPRTIFHWDTPGLSDAQVERYKKECHQEAYRIMATARTEGAAIVYGEETYIICMQLKGMIYKGKTVDWR